MAKIQTRTSLEISTFFAVFLLDRSRKINILNNDIRTPYYNVDYPFYTIVQISLINKFWSANFGKTGKFQSSFNYLKSFHKSICYLSRSFIDNCFANKFVYLCSTTYLYDASNLFLRCSLLINNLSGFILS